MLNIISSRGFPLLTDQVSQYKMQQINQPAGAPTAIPQVPPGAPSAP
jgi:hypothetical protein